MSKYYITVKLRDGRSVTVLDDDDYEEITNKLSNVIVNLSKNKFYPLTRFYTSWYINRDEIVEFQVQDALGRLVISPPEGEDDGETSQG